MVDMFDLVMRYGKALKLVELPEDSRDVDEVVVGDVEVDEAFEVAQSVDLDVVDVVGRHVEMCDGGCRRKCATRQRFERVMPERNEDEGMLMI